MPEAIVIILFVAVVLWVWMFFPREPIARTEVTRRGRAVVVTPGYDALRLEDQAREFSQTLRRILDGAARDLVVDLSGTAPATDDHAFDALVEALRRFENQELDHLKIVRPPAENRGAPTWMVFLETVDRRMDQPRLVDTLRDALPLEDRDFVEVVEKNDILAGKKRK